MRDYTPAETCMLLLFARLGEDPPLTVRSYRSLRRMLEALGEADGDPDRALDLPELLRLGQTRQEAEAILRRLERTGELETYLGYLRRRGITAVTRLSPAYPPRLRRVLGEKAPMVLLCAGNLNLMQRECAALVGSRALREPGRRFAAALGRRTAEQGLVYVSGGAAGADTAGYAAAMEAGGSALLFLADSLEKRMEAMAGDLKTGRLLLLSLGGADEAFSAGRAYARNTLIHAMGRKVFVAQTGNGTGGTWQGAAENLRLGLSPVYMCADEPEDPGARALIARGAVPAMWNDLPDLREPEEQLHL